MNAQIQIGDLLSRNFAGSKSAWSPAILQHAETHEKKPLRIATHSSLTEFAPDVSFLPDYARGPRRGSDHGG